jgi:hypothetical protein
LQGETSSFFDREEVEGTEIQHCASLN